MDRPLARRPGQRSPQQLLQAAVVVRERLLPPFACLRRDVRGRQGVVPYPAPETGRRQAEELPDLVDVLLGVGVEILAGRDVTRVAPEPREPAREHVEVTSLRQVGVVFVLRAQVTGL